MKESIKIEESAGRDALSASKADWKSVFGSSSCSPFSSWEWLSVWFDSFGADKSPFILKAYRGVELIGILPMFRETRGFAGIKSQRLALMGEGMGGADHLDLISRPEDRTEAMAAILDHLNKNDQAGIISLDNIDNGSSTLESIRKHAKRPDLRRHRTSESVAAVCPQIDLAAGWESVLAASRRADNFKRKLKKIIKQPGFEFRSVTSSAETGEAFERFLRLHEKRWEREGGSELSGHPRLIDFQRRLVNELSSAGMIRFDEVWLGGECRSSIYGMDDGRTFYYYNSGYDLEFSNLSVGLVLLGLSVQAAIERGNTLYDFLRGDETYKSDWANRRVDLVNIQFSRPSPSIIAQEILGGGAQKLRATAKAALPTRFTEPIANWRRSWNRKYQLSGR